MQAKEKKENRLLKELRFTLNQVKRSYMSIIGLAIVIFFVVIAIMAPILAPANQPDPYSNPRVISPYPLPPSSTTPFGTTGPPDYSDIYYGVIWGTRTSFIMAFTILAISIVLGVVLGAISGYFGGIIDEVIMRFTDIFFAVPGILLAMLIVVVMGRSQVSLIVALCAVYWCSYARLIRGEFLRVKVLPFIEAEVALGTPKIVIIFRHILPNVIAPALVLASMDIGSVVLSLSTLSFLGLGFRPGTAEWGVIISTARNWLLFGAWWTILFPGIAIFTFALGWNFIGDAFRDILDPRTRRGLV
jgi:peptide/nickel transport system permease protein